jgi:hypothetical protein
MNPRRWRSKPAIQPLGATGGLPFEHWPLPVQSIRPFLGAQHLLRLNENGSIAGLTRFWVAFSAFAA